MRHAIAHFHVVPLPKLALVEAAASRTARPWFGVAPIDDALRTACGDVCEFSREGMMATWPLFYLSERELIPSPQRYFQAPFAQRVAQGVELQDERKTHGAAFTATDANDLRDTLIAVSPTESEILDYWQSRTEEALGVEAATQRMREDSSVPELVANCHAASGWLLECLSRVDATSVALLIVRDARRRRKRWLTAAALDRGRGQWSRDPTPPGAAPASERPYVMPPTATKPVRTFVSACLNGRAEEVERLVADGLPADTCDQYKLSGLILAGRKGHVNVAKVLIPRGANIEYRDVTGRTPLFHAATFKRYEFVEYLASLGADVSPIDMHGWTPLDFAATSHFVKMTALLERLGAKRAATEA